MEINNVVESNATTTTDHDSHSGEYNANEIVFSLFLFIAAGLLEIGGGYLVWKGLREKYYPVLFVPLGFLALMAYGVVPIFQPLDSFGRVYAVYGGFFIVLSYAWAAAFDSFRPDAGDYIGAAIALAGVCVAWFWPR